MCVFHRAWHSYKILHHFRVFFRTRRNSHQMKHGTHPSHRQLCQLHCCLNYALSSNSWVKHVLKLESCIYVCMYVCMFFAGISFSLTVCVWLGLNGTLSTWWATGAPPHWSKVKQGVGGRQVHLTDDVLFQEEGRSDSRGQHEELTSTAFWSWLPWDMSVSWEKHRVREKSRGFLIISKQK